MLDLEPSNPEDLVEVSNERINAANRCHRAGTTLETYKKYLVKDKPDRMALPI